MKELKELDFSSLYTPYNLLGDFENGNESSFATFIAAGPKVNYHLNDDICLFGTAKYNFNLVESDGGDLIHQNGYFLNIGLKYMVY